MYEQVVEVCHDSFLDIGCPVYIDLFYGSPKSLEYFQGCQSVFIQFLFNLVESQSRRNLVSDHAQNTTLGLQPTLDLQLFETPKIACVRRNQDQSVGISNCCDLTVDKRWCPASGD